MRRRSIVVALWFVCAVSAAFIAGHEIPDDVWFLVAPSVVGIALAASAAGVVMSIARRDEEAEA